MSPIINLTQSSVCYRLNDPGGKGLSIEFACLTNLKELKADGNAITDLHGIADLDGLVKLSVANNCIETLDVSRTKW